MLSTELRNHIYDYLLEPTNVTLPVLSKISERVVRSMEKDYRNSAYICLGLNQTCRLLRKEFRPLWLRKASFMISQDNFLWFTAVFSHQLDEEKATPEMIRVVFDPFETPPPGCELIDEPSDVYRWDLAPLLRWRSQHSHTKIVCEPFTFGWCIDTRFQKRCMDCRKVVEKRRGTDETEWRLELCSHEADIIDHARSALYRRLRMANEMLALNNHDLKVDLQSYFIHRILLLEHNKYFFGFLEDRASSETAKSEFSAHFGRQTCKPRLYFVRYLKAIGIITDPGREAAITAHWWKGIDTLRLE